MSAAARMRRAAALWEAGRADFSLLLADAEGLVDRVPEMSAILLMLQSHRSLLNEMALELGAAATELEGQDARRRHGRSTGA